MTLLEHSQKIGKIVKNFTREYKLKIPYVEITGHIYGLNPLTDPHGLIKVESDELDDFSQGEIKEILEELVEEIHEYLISNSLDCEVELNHYKAMNEWETAGVSVKFVESFDISL